MRQVVSKRRSGLRGANQGGRAATRAPDRALKKCGRGSQSAASGTGVRRAGPRLVVVCIHSVRRRQLKNRVLVVGGMTAVSAGTMNGRSTSSGTRVLASIGPEAAAAQARAQGGEQRAVPQLRRRWTVSFDGWGVHEVGGEVGLGRDRNVGGSAGLMKSSRWN